MLDPATIGIGISGACDDGCQAPTPFDHGDFSGIAKEDGFFKILELLPQQRDEIMDLMGAFAVTQRNIMTNHMHQLQQRLDGQQHKIMDAVCKASKPNGDTEDQAIDTEFKANNWLVPSNGAGTSGVARASSAYGVNSSGVNSATSSNWDGTAYVTNAKDNIHQSYMELLQVLREAMSPMEYFLRKCGLSKSELESFRDWLNLRRLNFDALASLVSSYTFNMLTLALIMANAAFIAIDIDAQAKRSIEAYDLRSGGAASTIATPAWVRWIDLTFCLAFSIELILRMLAEELAFMFGPDWRWNVLDALLVFTSFLDLLISSAGTDLSFARIFRLARILRTLRIVRIMRFFRELRMIMLSIVSCLGPLMWALIFLTLIIFLVAVIFLQGVANYIEHASPSDPIALALGIHFENFEKTMLTLFMSVSGGINWTEVQELVTHVSPFYGFLFTFYIAMMVLGVLNIITGIFVQGASELAQLDRDLVTQQEMERNNLWMQELMKIFKELDQNSNGTITLDEFNQHSNKDHVQAFFGALQLDVSKAVSLFELLDVDGSYELEIDEFVIGCMRLKGMAKSIDMEQVLHDNRKQLRRWSKHFHRIEHQVKEVLSIVQKANSFDVFTNLCRQENLCQQDQEILEIRV